MIGASASRLGLVLVSVIVVQVFADPARQSAAPTTVTRIVAGPSGRNDRGTFVLNEERSIFSRVDDREVVALFQWSGTPGPHKLVAQWRSPDGGQTSNSTIDYLAREARFGAYWTLPLTPSTPLGVWSIEATVDGQPGGRLSFEVTDRNISSAVVKRVLSEAELFDRLNRVFIVLQRFSPTGKTLRSAAGFTREGLLYTSLSAIDGTGQVRVNAEGQAPVPVASLLNWHRLQDWAVVAGSGPPGPALPIAAPDRTQVGDRCYAMEGGVTSGRVLAIGTITGLRRVPESFIAAFSSGEAMIGAPVVNEFGELIGLVGGSGVPGAIREFDLLRFRAELHGVPVTPWSLVKVRADAAPVSLAELRTSGEVLAGTLGDDHILEAGFTRTLSKSEIRGTSETRDDFPSRDKSFMAFITWLPRERVRGQLVWRVIDSDGRVALASKPQKVDVGKGKRSMSVWEIPMLPAPGIYRVEASVEAGPMWRGFVRITP